MRRILLSLLALLACASAHAQMSNAQRLSTVGALPSGIVKSVSGAAFTTASSTDLGALINLTGILYGNGTSAPTVATAAQLGSAFNVTGLMQGNGLAAPTAYAGSTCGANTFASSTTSAGVLGCTSIPLAALASSNWTTTQQFSASNAINIGSTLITGAPYGVESASGSAAMFNFAGGTGATAVGAQTRWSADAFGPVFILGHSRNATINTQTIVQNGDQLGRFIYCGSDGTICGTFVDLVGYVEGSPSAGTSYPGEFCIQTTPSSAVATVKTLCAHQDRGVTLGANADEGADIFNATTLYQAGTPILQLPGNIRTVSGTTDTLLSTDCQGTVRYTSASATTVTVPSSTLATNCIVTLIADGASMTVTGSGLTLQLGGTTTTGNRAAVNGGIVTLQTVSATKAFAAGPGVS